MKDSCMACGKKPAGSLLVLHIGGGILICSDCVELAIALIKSRKEVKEVAMQIRYCDWCGAEVTEVVGDYTIITLQMAYTTEGELTEEVCNPCIIKVREIRRKTREVRPAR